MKKFVVSGAVVAVAVACATSVLADLPKIQALPQTSRILLPKTGTLVNIPGIAKAPSLPAALAPAEKTSLMAAIAANKPANLPMPSRTPFVASPADLKVGSIETRLMFAEWVYPEFADFGSTGGVFVISGIADGAWYVDCSITTTTQSGSPFTISTTSKSSSGASMGSASQTQAASNGHVHFGAYFNGGAGGANALIFARQDHFTWHRCAFTPVN